MLFFFLLALVSTVAANVIHHNVLAERDREMLVGDRNAVVTDFTPHPFIILFYNPVTKYYHGHGVVVNSNWVLTRARNAKAFETLKASVFMYKNIGDPKSINTATIAYTMGYINVHPDYVANNINHDIAMVQSCENLGVTTVATIPPVSQTYNIGVKVNFFVEYLDKLKWGENEISANSNCVSNVGTFDPAYHYCLHRLDVYVFDSYSLNRAPFVLTKDNKLIGFVMGKTSNSNYATVLKIETQRAWLTSQFPFLV